MANEDSFHLGIKVLVTDPDNHILLLKVNLEQLSGYNGTAYWDIPGGRIKRNATVRETLARELHEETGLDLIEPVELVGAVLSNIRIPAQDNDIGLILFVYRCSWPDRPIIRLSSEHTEYWWATPNEAADALETKYPVEFTNLIRQRREALTLG